MFLWVGSLDQIRLNSVYAITFGYIMFLMEYIWLLDKKDAIKGQPNLGFIEFW